MPIIKGTTRIGAIYKGTTPISAIYKGTTLIFSSYVWENYAFTNLYNSIIPSAISSKNVLDKAKISKIYANGVIENQLVQNGESEKTSITAGNVKVIQYQFNCVSGHKYLCSIFTKTTGTPDTLRLRTYFSSTVATTIAPTSNYSQNNIIVSANQTSATGSFEVQYIKNDSVFDGDVWAKECEIFDLTLMFGTGNEPTTLTDNRIQKLLNRGYIDYNAGSYKGTDISEIGNGLPIEYQEVEYIESSGTQYIDSGVSASSITPIVKIKFYYRVRGSADLAGIFGSWGSNDTRFGLYYNGIGIGTNIAYNFENNNMYEVEMNGQNGTAIVNGTSITGFNINNGFNSQNLLLFARMGNGHVESDTTQKLYSCQIYNNSVLVRNFVTCYRKSDNEIGLYDLVNGVFYINQGTGTFLKGNDVNGNQISLRYQGNGALSAHDTYEITDTSHIFTKNVSSVDLGSQTWRYDSNFSVFYNTSTDSSNAGLASWAKIVCSKYTTDLNKYASNLQNMAMTTRGYYFDKNVCIKDTNYTDANDFKTAMSGVMLYYELATPQVITIPRKKLAWVDLGSLNWSVSSGRFYTNDLQSLISLVPDRNTVGKIYCSKYLSYMANNNSSTDLAIIEETNGQIYIRDNRFNGDATAFTNALSGTYLFYETNEEVADITTQLGIESGGTLTSDSLVLPNVDTLIKCK